MNSRTRGADKPARTNTGASIRGKTISHPIPIPDDDEFAIRTPGTGIALPLGPEALEREMRLRTSTATEELHPSAPPSMESDGMAQTTTYPTNQSPHAQVSRVQLPKTTRDSVSGSVPSGSSVGKPKRSFKSMLGRMFGKKKKHSLGTSSKSGSEALRAGQHRSDPTALSRNPQDIGGAKRSASLPIDEFNRALRSHSVVAGDIPQSTRSSLNGDSAQSNVQLRSRRATTPSRLWTPNKTSGYVEWTGLSPRPASIHVRGSMLISDADAAAIGTAITTSSHPNRRSRSLGEIRDTALATTVARRRSDEIKYWRESHDPTVLSPMSSNRPEAEQPILADEEEARDIPPSEPPQPFNFGPLGALTGMKITEVASLETRVQRLEDRMLKMETMITRSLENLNSEPPLPRQESSRRRSPGRKSSIPRPKMNSSETSLPRPTRYRERQPDLMPQMRSSSYSSSRRPSTTNSQHNSAFDTCSQATTQHTSEPLSSSQIAARPLSVSTTIRGLPSSPVSREGTLTGEHYTALTNMILAEQNARQQLESLVVSLQEQLRSRSLHAASNFKSDPNVAFSTFEHDDSSDDGRYVGEDMEVFRTPNEDLSAVGVGGFGDEIFGDLLRNSASEEVGLMVKAAPRTLSLSQITLGKDQQTTAVSF